MPKKKFELVQGNANKFWNIEQKGNTQTVTYGRVGSVGRTVEKLFNNANDARESFSKMIEQKTKKGYREVGSVRKKAKSKKTEPKKAKSKAVKRARKLPVKKSKPSVGEPTVRIDQIDPKTIIGRDEDSAIEKGEQFESIVLLCLTNTHAELYQHATWRRKGKNGKWQTKPSFETRDRQRTKLKDIKSVALLSKGKKKRLLRVRTDRRVTIDQSNKDGTAAWSNSREKSYCFEFEGTLKTISECRAKINAAIKSVKKS